MIPDFGIPTYSLPTYSIASDSDVVAGDGRGIAFKNNRNIVLF